MRARSYSVSMWTHKEAVSMGLLLCCLGSTTQFFQFIIWTWMTWTPKMVCLPSRRWNRTRSSFECVYISWKFQIFVMDRSRASGNNIDIFTWNTLPVPIPCFLWIQFLAFWPCSVRSLQSGQQGMAQSASVEIWAWSERRHFFMQNELWWEWRCVSLGDKGNVYEIGFEWDQIAADGNRAAIRCETMGHVDGACFCDECVVVDQQSGSRGSTVWIWGFIAKNGGQKEWQAKGWKSHIIIQFF